MAFCQNCGRELQDGMRFCVGCGAANTIIVRIQVPDFDPSELRAIQNKQQETGFINVCELMLLQKAGFNRPSEVPPKPHPHDRRRLRERARQKMFVGEPRSL